jgi:two-component system chemotaxis response regulator CheB
MKPAAPGDLRVVVIDDSAYVRQTIAELLSSAPGLRVVGRAADGEEGLKEVLAKQPDLVTLDLDMPRMDGFTFLRLLMHKRPTPVLGVTGVGERDEALRALELGAYEIVAKPSRGATPEVRAIRDDLIAKARGVRQLRGTALAERAAAGPPRVRAAAPACAIAHPPSRLVAIGASTGGPPALAQLLGALDGRLAAAVLVSQHMPAQFTRAFAERLECLTPFRVREAADGDSIERGLVLVAPGRASLTLARGGALRVVLEGKSGHVQFTPSVDRMLESAAAAMGADLLAVILTGMRGDGARGVRAVRAAGGRVIAEARESAVIFGMPEEAIATGAVDEVLPLAQIPAAIERFVARRSIAR